MRRDVYSGRLKLNGDEHEETVREANNYTGTLLKLRRFEEAKSLLRKTIPVARRVLGENHNLTLMMKWNYALALYQYADATLDDLREAVNTLEETERTARHVLGGAHPTRTLIDKSLIHSRAVLRAHDTPSARSA